MTASQDGPVDPHLLAEVAPGEGPEPGSVEYGGSQISNVRERQAAPSGADQFEDLPDQCVTPSRSGGGSSVAVTTATSSTTRRRPGFGQSASPSMPSAA